MSDLTKPATQDPSVTTVPPAPAAAIEPVLAAGAGVIRVLHVDDDPDVTAALSHGLRKQRFEVHSAGSADEALRILAQREIDVVVSDEQMPGTSGSKFLALVRRQWPETMRIMLSGCTDFRATLDAINEAHVFRFLTKPCSSEDVAFCISQAAAVRDAARAASESARPPGGAEPDANRFQKCLDTLWMAYQPVVRASTSGLYAYEALVRSDDAAFTGALDLIRHAERLSAIDVLDDRIRELIADDLEQITSSANVLVNVHPRSLLEEKLYAEDGPLRRFSHRVIFEITERQGLEAIPDLKQRVSRLRRAGYRIAVDDLGSGYSGLSTFAQLVPDFVKFDMDLIRGIDGSLTKAKLLQSIASLCHDLKILTIAEGIETVAERRRVTDLGCDLLQGFQIGRPARLKS
jgi:EAL domain-containing protein (putative c-di-GMP-specific phosphodiesterase class I)